MRILVFCDEDLSVPGGGARQVIELSRGLASRGHALRVVMPAPLLAQQAARALQGLQVDAAAVIRVRGLRPLSYLLSSARALASVMTDWRPDVLLWFDSPGQVGPLWAIRRAACPYVLFVNGLPQEELTGFWTWPPIAGLVAAALRRAVREAHAVVSVCDEILGWMQQEWGLAKERCRIIRNGVDPDLFRPVDPREARRALGLEEQGAYIVFVGGFFPWHGLELLIEAAPEVLKALPGVRFLLVGDGQTRSGLERQVRRKGLEDAVRFPGRVGYHEVPTWIGAGEVGVVLHRATRSYPGDSMKLWEYLACGRPVVATAGPGYGDLVTSVGAGRSVRAGDAESLAHALLSLLKADERARREMGERGRRAVLEAHSWAARAEQLDSLLSDAVGTRVQG
jgi:glycosyltransferase involved in cell wall biosynthesis